MIELKNIKKYYKMGDDIVKALDDISLTINDGEFVSIIGPSGSGKSTLMNIMGCLDKVTEGEYFVDGTEISKFSEKQLAFLRNKKMGFIFQGFNLLQNLNAYENVELPLIYQGISNQERKKIVLESLNAVGMSDRIKHKPNELSGGQQQRVAIARALATKPMCILADEPTGNLDSKTGEEIIKILKQLNYKGTTVVVITHNEEITKYSNRIIRIYDGKIESDELNQNSVEIEIKEDIFSSDLEENKSENFANNENEFEKINESINNENLSEELLKIDNNGDDLKTDIISVDNEFKSSDLLGLDKSKNVDINDNLHIVKGNKILIKSKKSQQSKEEK
ncbi:MAG: ABC transporter ATP-binding protein [Clostridia bacterium]|nr:ABC transporter ATP-binding protein [Clostridia bacterium]